MGFLSRTSTVSSPARTRASLPGPTNNWWYQTPEGWTLPLEAAGLIITPELALTLTTVHCIVSTISDDFGTMTCQMFEDLFDDGQQRVKFTDPIVGPLAYRLQWQPNLWQSAKAFWSTLAWQYLLRPAAYAEIIRRPGTDMIDQMVPRHPDRVRQERLADGGLRFQLTEPNGTTRAVLQQDMFVVRNTSSDGLNAISRPRFGSKAIASALALQDFTRNYFKKGATAALMATYKGEKKEDEEEAALHASISRYLSGPDNAGGFLLVDEDLDIKTLGVEPQKAELLGLKNLSRRELCALWKFAPHKAGIEGTQTYASQVQSAQEYVTGCQMPMVVEFEQAIKMWLLTGNPRYIAKFNMDYLLRADLKTRMEAYEIGIRARVFRPSEARVKENLPPDARLDQLSESDYRPGTKGGSSQQDGGSQAQSVGSGRTARADVRAILMVHDAAVRCVRRERHAITKIAKDHPSDVQKWQDGVRAFYEEHAGYVAQQLRMPIAAARAYAAQHGTVIEDQGVIAMSDHWERTEAEELAALSLEPMDIAA